MECADTQRLEDEKLESALEKLGAMAMIPRQSDNIVTRALLSTVKVSSGGKAMNGFATRRISLSRRDDASSHYNCGARALGPTVGFVDHTGRTPTNRLPADPSELPGIP